MKLFLLALCIFATAVSATVPKRFLERGNVLSKRDPELLKLAGSKRFVRNETIPLRSAKFSKPTIAPRHADVHVEEFETRLDHFSATNTEMVEFQYFLKDEYFYYNGPIFIYINDGGAFTTEFLQTGLMHDIAPTVGAALITADLRYFRSNLPTANASFESLQFSSVEQSVADISFLVEAVKEELNSPDSNVILWGTGLGASLAAWAKQEYPDLIQGVWASSGIFEQTLVTHEPYEVLADTIREVGGEECAEDLENAFIEFEFLIRTYEWFFVEEALDLCIFIWDFYDEEMAIGSHGLIEIILKYFEVYHEAGIRNFCSDIRSNNREEAFDAFARWVRHIFTDQNCLELDYYQRVNLGSQENWQDIETTSWSPIDRSYPFESRPLLYQRCTQLANLPLTVNSGTIFGRLIQHEFWFVYCNDVFGYETEYDYTQLAGAAAALNQRFGGQNPNVDNIIFTNGVLDPYFSFGITEFSGEDSYVFNIPSHFKSADLFSEARFDHPELNNVKSQIRQIITEWARR